MGKPQVSYEAGQTAYPFEALTDDGDATLFTAANSPWSDLAGHEPVIAPYGLMTGGAVTPTGTDNQVSVAALTASMAGVSGADSNGVVSVSSGTLLATRGTDTNPYQITSLTVDSDGDLAAIAGTAGSAFTDDRGANGGPPYIPVGSIEIGQVRLSSDTDAAVTQGEIFTVDGLHVERSDWPVSRTHYVTGAVEFSTALPLIHTGDVPKLVYARYSTPLFSPVPNSSDWVPAESTHSVTSTETYDGPIGAESSSLGQASFSANGLRDGMSDPLMQAKGRRLWFRFHPDRDKSYPHQLTQGTLGVSRTFPASGGGINASCTVTPREESRDVLE